MSELPPYKDPNHPTNKPRPNLKCWGCGKRGVTGRHWGQWCFECNVKRIEREQVMSLLIEQWNTRATLSQPTADRREIVARIKADPGDGTLHPDLAHVLARGFDTMGWDRPASAAEDMIDAILAALDGGR